MEWALTLLFAAMAAGLLWEASRALRSRARLPAWAALLSAFGLFTALQRSIGTEHGWPRRLAGIALAMAWLTCVAVYLRNREDTPQPPQ